MVSTILIFLGGGFLCLVVPAIILTVLIVSVRDKGSDGLAILSLITGILGLFMLPIVGSIAAVVSGNIALSQYKLLTQTGVVNETMARTGNEGMARAGVILGWIGLGIWLVGVIGVLLFLVPARVITSGI